MVRDVAGLLVVFLVDVAGSQPKRTPLAWDPAQPYRGLGFREVEAEGKPVNYAITELPVQPVQPVKKG